MRRCAAAVLGLLMFLAGIAVAHLDRSGSAVSAADVDVAALAKKTLALEDRLAKLEARGPLAPSDTSNSATVQQLAKVDTRLTVLERNVGDLYKSLDTLNKSQDALNKTVAAIPNVNGTIDDFKLRINALEGTTKFLQGGSLKLSKMATAIQCGLSNFYGHVHTFDVPGNSYKLVYTNANGNAASVDVALGTAFNQKQSTSGPLGPGGGSGLPSCIVDP